MKKIKIFIKNKLRQRRINKEALVIMNLCDEMPSEYEGKSFISYK